jgi:hypothetical protein
MTPCSLTLENLFLRKVRTHLPDYPHVIISQNITTWITMAVKTSNSCFGSIEILQHTIHLNPLLKCAVHVKHVVCTWTKSRRRCATQWDVWCIYVSERGNATDGCIQSGVPRSKEQPCFRPYNRALSCIIQARNSCHVHSAAQQRKRIFTSHHWTWHLSTGFISLNLTLHVFMRVEEHNKHAWRSKPGLIPSTSRGQWAAQCR